MRHAFGDGIDYSNAAGFFRALPLHDLMGLSSSEFLKNTQQWGDGMCPRSAALNKGLCALAYADPRFWIQLDEADGSTRMDRIGPLLESVSGSVGSSSGQTKPTSSLTHILHSATHRISFHTARISHQRSSRHRPWLGQGGAAPAAAAAVAPAAARRGVRWRAYGSGVRMRLSTRSARIGHGVGTLPGTRTAQRGGTRRGRR